MADVFQLAHIAGELKIHQAAERSVGDALGFNAQVFGTFLQEQARQCGHVFAAFAQCGQAKTDDVQAVKKVFSKHTLFDAIFQILVRGGDDAHVRSHGAVTAHAVELAVAQNTQQTGLKVKRHVSDFVQEQGAAIGLLKAATACGLRTGESAALVAEEFAFQQILGYGRCVDGHKRPAGTRAVFVQCAGHQFLARARFAGNQHGDDALAQATYGAKHVLHGGGLPQHFRHLGDALVGHILTQAFLQSAADQLDCFGHVKRLGQVLKCTTLESAHGAVQVGVGRHDDDGQGRKFFLYLAQQIDA